MKVDQWLKNSIMVIVLLFWSVYMGWAFLIDGLSITEIPELVWGIPTGAYFLLNPTLKRSSSDSPAKGES